MTPRQFLLRAIKGEPVGRVPVAPFVHVNFVGAYFQDKEVDQIQGVIEVCERFGFDIIHRNCTPPYNELGADTDAWEVENSVEKSVDSETTTTVIHTPDGDLRQVHRLNWVSEYDVEASPLEYLIKSESDFDLVREYQPPIEQIDISLIGRARQTLGDRGIVAPWVQGVFNHVGYYYRAVDELIMDAMLNPDFYKALMDYFLERNKSIAAQHIAAGVDMLSYGGNIASGKMVGGPFFGEHVLDYENRMIDFIQSQGVAVLYHNCGYAKSLFPYYKGLNTQVYESLTPPPHGDTILEEALEAFRPETVLAGGVDQISFLPTASKDEIRDKVRAILDPAKKRGNFILGTTDYFHEETPHDAIRVLADAGREFGDY